MRYVSDKRKMLSLKWLTVNYCFSFWALKSTVLQVGKKTLLKRW